MEYPKIFNLFFTFLIISINISFAQTNNIENSDSTISVKINGINGSNAEQGDIKFTDGSNTLLRITDEGNYGAIEIKDGVPTTNNNKLYNDAGTLKFGSSILGGSGASSLNALSDAKYDGNSLFVGPNSGFSNAGGGYNTAFGEWSMYSNLSGHANTAIGFTSLWKNSTGSYNTAFGIDALTQNTTGGSNTAIGSYALSRNTTGRNNTAVGISALRNSSIQSDLVAIGDSALLNNGLGTTSIFEGSSNTAVGNKALLSNTSGSYNIAVGGSSLRANTTGQDNTAIGLGALGQNTSGSNNTALGANALSSNVTGVGNTAVGKFAHWMNINGNSNTAVGYLSLGKNTIGPNNVAIGYSAGGAATYGSNNTFIGYYAGGHDIFGEVSQHGCVFIGHQAGYDEYGSNKLYIENTNSTTPLIGGDFNANEIYLNSYVGVGTMSPIGTLHINDFNTTEPAIFIEGGSSTEGDITWKSGEDLQIGTWNTSTNAFSEKMRIMSGGNVGIGTTAINYSLEVNGTAGKNSGSSWSNSSDIRLKNILGSYEKGLNEIAKLRTIRFKYKKDNARNLPNDNTEYGFVAQEVQKVFPEAVNKGQDGYLDFNMHTINVALVNAVQELKEENDGLEERVKYLEEALLKLLK